MKGVRWHPAAIADVEAAIEFGRTRWPMKAKSLAGHLIEVVEQLQIFPMSGREGIDGTRELVLASYPLIVIYEPLEHEVVILRVPHQRRKWPA